MSVIFEQAAADWRTMREDFQLVLDAAYQAAERDTRGALLNHRGRATGIDPETLFTGPYVRVLAYGSEELIDWFEQHGRPNLAAYERQWLTNSQPH